MNSNWLPIESAPVSTTLEMEHFLAFCPDDDWSPLGKVHIAVKFEHHAKDKVRVVGSNNERRATHWQPKPADPE